MDLLDFTPKTDDVVITLKVKDTILTNADGSEMTITFYSPYSKEAKNLKRVETPALVLLRLTRSIRLLWLRISSLGMSL
jgi:hypothetical protein